MAMLAFLMYPFDVPAKKQQCVTRVASDATIGIIVVLCKGVVIFETLERQKV